ncbi:MAG: family transcriptional regulator, cyclic receptor protein [Actinomycetota bacterium]|nr:family transcriptional regulator, cyclic receptor protein [Actinomycetota bacterium]
MRAMSTANQEASGAHPESFEPEFQLRTLEEAPFLVGASDRSKKDLEAASRVEFFDEGSDVVKQGELPTEVIVIKKGSLRIYVDEPDGLRRDIRTMGPGQILGELGVLGGHRRTASAEALTDTEVWVIERDAFAEVYSSDPQITIEIAKVMAPYILEDDELAMDVLSLSLRGRVVKRLQELTTSEAAVTLPRLATLSGGPQSDVISVLEQLQREGAIQLSGGGISVVDHELLSHFN